MLACQKCGDTRTTQWVDLGQGITAALCDKCIPLSVAIRRLSDAIKDLFAPITQVFRGRKR